MNDEMNISDSSNLDEDSNEQNLDISNEVDGDKLDNNLEDINTELKSEIDELKNKLLRVSAEYDNYRKRTLKEKEELYGRACLDVIIQILPVLDNLERANSTESDLESLSKGIGMVINLFYDALKKLDIVEIDSNGEFNPNLHEAVAHVSDENLGKNTIVEVLQKGYIRNEKVIRHSMVKVAN